jgi:hypothetical protein
VAHPEELPQELAHPAIDRSEAHGEAKTRRLLGSNESSFGGDEAA